MRNGRASWMVDGLLAEVALNVFLSGHSREKIGVYLTEMAWPKLKPEISLSVLIT